LFSEMESGPEIVIGELRIASRIFWYIGKELIVEESERRARSQVRILLETLTVVTIPKVAKNVARVIAK